MLRARWLTLRARRLMLRACCCSRLFHPLDVDVVPPIRLHHTHVPQRGSGLGGAPSTGVGLGPDVYDVWATEQ